jgi:hypothetical protein
VVKGLRSKRLALLVSCGLVAVVVAGCGSSSRPTATHLKRYHDSDGWMLAYPRAFHLEHSSTQGGHVDFDEVTVGSFPMRSAIHKSKYSTQVLLPRTSSGSFPSDGVALRVLREYGGPFELLPSTESRFPLRLSSFHRSTSYSRPALERRVVADGADYWLEAWIGPKAPARERAILAHIVRSITFPRLYAGETLGNLGVFARATRYPVGSFTPVRVEGFPFYLVRAPGGWYAVGWKWGIFRAGGYRHRCRLQLDRATKQFFCTNMRARWDRVGRVLVKPRSAREGDPLDLNVVALSWDRHVLVDPGASRNNSDTSYVHQLWPSVYP